MPRAQRIHHVTLLVRDIEQAKNFYGMILGLTPVDRPTFPGLPRGAFFRCEGVQVHLTEFRDIDNPPLAQDLPAPELPDVTFQVWNRHVAFQVDDIWSMLEKLQKAEVEIIQVPRMIDSAELQAEGPGHVLVRGWMKMYGMVPLFCRDPSGNMIEIVPIRQQESLS